MKTISLFSKSFFQKILSSSMGNVQERFVIKRGLWWCPYGVSNFKPNTSFYHFQPINDFLAIWVTLHLFISEKRPYNFRTKYGDSCHSVKNERKLYFESRIELLSTKSTLESCSSKGCTQGDLPQTFPTFPNPIY